jgi:hypothetical protein
MLFDAVVQQASKPETKPANADPQPTSEPQTLTYEEGAKLAELESKYAMMRRAKAEGSGIVFHNRRMTMQSFRQWLKRQPRGTTGGVSDETESVAEVEYKMRLAEESDVRRPKRA